MIENEKLTNERSNSDGEERGKRPIILWIVPIFLILASLFAFYMVLSDPFATTLSTLLGLSSVLVQFVSGALLLRGYDLGRRLYLYAIPIVILAQALYVGSKMGFNDDDFLVAALLPFIIYGLFVFLLTRPPVKKWLANGPQLVLGRRS